MKITNAESIKSGEKGLIDAVTSDIDWDMIREVLHNKYQLVLEDGDVEYRSGDLVVHDNQVAYKLDFDVKISLSVLLNRQGECFDVDVAAPAPAAQVPPPVSPVSDDAGPQNRAENLAPAPAAEPVAAHAADLRETAGGSETTAPAASPPKDAPTPSQIADMIASINRD